MHSNHLKISHVSMFKLLSKFFSCLVHGYLPSNMTFGVLLPLIKDKFEPEEDIQNYRPIISSSVILKLFEYCLKYKISKYVNICDKQHGFRPQHSTSTACLTLKEVVTKYNKRGSNVYAAFVDLSKAFDKINHYKLMDSLIDKGVPHFYVNILLYFYRNQLISTKHQNEMSSSWKIGNGVRQGGILSPFLFNIYVDGLIDNISRYRTGCFFGIKSCNIIAYADDMVLLSPSKSGLQKLLHIFGYKAKELNLTINTDKTVCMNFKVNNSSAIDPCLTLDGKVLRNVNKYKYLGFMIDEFLNNDLDIVRCRNKFYNEFNSILRKFSGVDHNVFMKLFESYCIGFYGSELWFNNKRCGVPLKQFGVGYHKAIKKIFGFKYWESNHKVCEMAGVKNFIQHLNWQKIRFVYRLLLRPPAFIDKCINYFMENAFIVKEVKVILLNAYDIESLLGNDIDAIKSRIFFKQHREPTLR